jgi:outer membrane protein assembly factor BamB
LWSIDGTTAATCGTLVWDGDIVYASGGYPKSETLAVRVSKSGGEVLWRNRQNCYEESMLATAGHLYALTGKGVMYCWNGQTGIEQWSQRLKGPVSCSPVLAGGHLYWTNEAGTTYVFKPKPEKFELAAQNQLGEEGFASPAVSRGQIFVRTATRSGGQRQEWLYCLGKQE